MKPDQSLIKELESFFGSNIPNFVKFESYLQTIKYEKYGVNSQPLRKVFDSTCRLKSDPYKINVTVVLVQQANIVNQETIDFQLTNLQIELLEIKNLK